MILVPRNDELAGLLMETVPRIMGDLRRRILETSRAELTLPQLMAMRAVSHRESVTVGGLAEHLGVGRSAASKIAQSLVVKGLLVRAPAADDRRQVLLAMSPKAKAGWKAMREEGRALLAKRLADLTAAERDALAKGLRGLQRVL